MFVWRAIEEKIASAVALRNRGINSLDTVCKTCGAAEESAAHILLRCNFAERTWELVTNWLKIPMVNVEGSLTDLLVETSEVQRSKGVRKAIYAVIIQTIWILWKTRNEKVFKGRQGKVQTVIEEIKEASYLGVKLRSKHGSLTRQEWWDFNVMF
ncbi:putative reverse transcriptase zinc-binding domain-containing protein [Helianthus annuus]|uniref:Reverse transcriptase zinc-binding domain-containing protein n=1 Tax=Helianthus annuus TaxID=4232 RepID=A0A9K3GU25_HELAN|nr:putative reverse transcriptase zinc-binding domain-containing protein [Helianthus annuus]